MYLNRLRTENYNQLPRRHLSENIIYVFLSFLNITFSPVILRFLENPGRLSLRLLNLVSTLVRAPWTGVELSQGLYLHRIAQHTKTRADIHNLSGIRSNDSSIQEMKFDALYFLTSAKYTGNFMFVISGLLRSQLNIRNCNRYL